MKGPAVPWNAMWSGEERYEVRPCSTVQNRRAVWQPYAPGTGRPLFAKPHMVRQRRSIAHMLCTVCGEPTPTGDRWWFKLGRIQEGWFMTTEAPVHRACADFALTVCPHLRGQEAELEPMPGGYRVLSALVAGHAVDRDFGLSLSVDRPVIGNLKLAWPERMVEVKR